MRNLIILLISLVASISFAGNERSSSVSKLNNGNGSIEIPSGVLISESEIGALDGVSSNLQTQLDSKASKAGDTLTGSLAVDNNQGINLFEADASGSQKAMIRVPALALDYTLTLPIDDGNADQVLKTDGSGGLFWADASGGGAELSSVGEDIVPDLNDARAIGSNTKKWTELHLSDAYFSTHNFFMNFTNDIPGLILDGESDAATASGASSIIMSGNGANDFLIGTSEQSSASSKNIYLSVGSTSAAASFGGSIYIQGGNAGGAASTGGSISLESGVSDGNSGNIGLSTGSSASGDSGNINLSVGSAAGTRGNIIVNSKIVPSADLSASLGSSSLRFAEIHGQYATIPYMDVTSNDGLTWYGSLGTLGVETAQGGDIFINSYASVAESDNGYGILIASDLKPIMLKADGADKAVIVNAAGLKLDQSTSGAKPTCDSSTRGMLWFTQGGPGVADTFEVCLRDNDVNYGWTSLIPGPS